MITLTVSGITYHGMWNHIQDIDGYKDIPEFRESLDNPVESKRGKGRRYTFTFTDPDHAAEWIDSVKSQGEIGLWTNASNSDRDAYQVREWAAMRRDAASMTQQLQGQGVKLGIQHP